MTLKEKMARKKAFKNGNAILKEAKRRGATPADIAYIKLYNLNGISSGLYMRNDGQGVSMADLQRLGRALRADGPLVG